MSKHNYNFNGVTFINIKSKDLCFMKKIILVVLIILSFFIQIESNLFAEENIKEPNKDKKEIPAGDYPLVKDKLIVKALDSLIGTDGEWARRSIAGHNKTNHSIKVLFKNLSEISPEFKDHDALGWQDESGQLLIFINEKHKNAPEASIGSLLAHESIHQDRVNSIQEETYGWTYEAEVWMQLKEKYPELKTIAPGEYPLVDRENLMEMLFRKANFSSKLIEEKVHSNFSYKSLPETSPGFGQ